MSPAEEDREFVRRLQDVLQTYQSRVDAFDLAYPPEVVAGVPDAAGAGGRASSPGPPGGAPAGRGPAGAGWGGGLEPGPFPAPAFPAPRRPGPGHDLALTVALPRAWTSPGGALAAAAALALAGYLGIAVYDRAAGNGRRPAAPAAPAGNGRAAWYWNSETHLSRPSMRPSGLDRYVGNWLTADADRGKVFVFNGQTGEVVLERDAAGISAGGATTGNACVWTADALGGIQKRHMRTLDVLARFRAPGPAARVLHFDGSVLWVADRQLRRVYLMRPDGETLSSAGQFPLKDESPDGLWVTGNLLWVLDRSRQTVRRYEVGASLVPQDRLDLAGRLPAGAKASGLAVADSTLWLAADGPAALYGKRLTGLDWTAE